MEHLAGNVFLDWLAPPTGLRWVDVGCGNGAFTELLMQRCAPASARGIDPSAGQLEFARSRPGLAAASFVQGEATALPYADDSADAAVMALVIFFVPDPAAGVAEMVRVVKPGGLVAAYSWDILGAGFPIAPVNEEMAAVGLAPLWPPSVEASRMAVAQRLWEGAGLVQIETREIHVQRSFADFETYWAIAQTGPRIRPRLSTLSAEVLAGVKERVRARLVPGSDGRITCDARANAIRGVVAG